MCQSDFRTCRIRVFLVGLVLVFIIKSQALYDKKIATFKMELLCRWSKGEFEALGEGHTATMDDGAMEDEE